MKMKKKMMKKNTKNSNSSRSNSDMSEHLLLTDSKLLEQHAVLSFSVAN